MSILTLGRKRLIVNNAAEFPARVTGTGQNAILHIDGFGHFPVSRVAGTVRGTRGKAGNKHVMVIEPGDITIKGSVVAGTVVNVRVKFTSYNNEIEFSQYSEYFGKGKAFQIVCAANETAAGFLDKLYDAITTEITQDYFTLLTATRNPGSGTLVDLTLTSRQNGLAFKIEFLGEAEGFGLVKSDVVTAFTPAVTVANEGNNTYDVLKTLVLQTEVTVAPYGLEGKELPVAGATYSAIQFQQAFDRDDVFGNAAVDAKVTAGAAFEIFVLESAGANTTYRDLILDTLLTKTGVTQEHIDATGATVATAALFKA